MLERYCRLHRARANALRGSAMMAAEPDITLAALGDALRLDRRADVERSTPCRSPADAIRSPDVGPRPRRGAARPPRRLARRARVAGVDVVRPRRRPRRRAPGCPGCRWRSPGRSRSSSLVESSRPQVRVHRPRGRGCAVSRTSRSPPTGRGAGRERERFDIVTARALAPLEVVAEYAAPLLRSVASWWPGGVARPRERGARRRGRPRELGLEIGDVVAGRPISRRRAPHLHLMSKVGRRRTGSRAAPGSPRKRPLGRPVARGLTGPPLACSG